MSHAGMISALDNPKHQTRARRLTWSDGFQHCSSASLNIDRMLAHIASHRFSYSGIRSASVSTYKR